MQRRSHISAAQGQQVTELVKKTLESLRADSHASIVWKRRGIVPRVLESTMSGNERQGTSFPGFYAWERVKPTRANADPVTDEDRKLTQR